MNDLTLQERLQQPDLAPRKIEETLDLVEYWRAISKRRWSIIGLTILVSILALLVANNMRPIYRSTVTLLIEQGRSKVVSIKRLQPGRHPARVLPDTSRDPEERRAGTQGREEAEPPVASRFRRAPDATHVPQSRDGHRSRRSQPGSRGRGHQARDRPLQARPAGGPCPQQPACRRELLVLRPGSCGPGAEHACRDLHRERPRITHGHDAESGRVAARAHGRAAFEGGCLGKGAAGLSRTRAHRGREGRGAFGGQQAARGADRKPRRVAAEARRGRGRADSYNRFVPAAPRRATTASPRCFAARWCSR